MKIVEHREPLADFSASLPYLSEDLLFVDIETTGFAAEHQPIYLIGTAFLSGDSLLIRQYFAETRNDEPTVLDAFFKEWQRFSRIVSFNGDRFDLPYLQTRGRLFGIDESLLTAPESFDLLKTIRRRRGILPLEHFNQKSVETFLGIDREDELDGGQLIPVYKRYEKQPNEKDERLLLLHNYDDMKGMVHVLPMCAYERLNPNEFVLENADWDTADGHLFLDFTMNERVPVALRLKDDSYYLIIEENRLKAALLIVEGRLHYYFPYPAQYVYLLREGTVVPKVLAASIPAAEKRPATKEECFTVIFGIFLGFSSSFVRKHSELFADEKLFKRHYDDNLSYIKTDPDDVNEDFFRVYLGLLITTS